MSRAFLKVALVSVVAATSAAIFGAVFLEPEYKKGAPFLIPMMVGPTLLGAAMMEKFLQAEAREGEET